MVHAARKRVSPKGDDDADRYSPATRNLRSVQEEKVVIMDPETYDRLNPPFEFAEASLTPRKRAILAWLEANQIRLRSSDPENPRSMTSLRVYIPIDLSRADMAEFLELAPPLSDPLIELFDYEFTLEYVDSYPWADKYRLIPKNSSSR